MAKCSICLSKKGQRDCGLTGFQVCSLCCGQSRKLENCRGCEYYKDAKSMRNYKGVPRFSTMEMEKRPELQTYSDSIESTLCLWDNSFQNQLKDEAALNVLEMLLDKHYFHDENISAADEEVQKGFEMVSESLAQDLPDISEEILYKVLGVIHFVAQRRTTGRREYFDIIHRHVDFKVGPEMRAQSLLSKIKHTAWG